MKLKYKGKMLEVSDAFMHDMMTHAVLRGITLEEYIAEAFTMLEHKPVTIINDRLLYQSTTGLDHNAKKIKDN
jgi:radical SAM superfamily enzyme